MSLQARHMIILAALILGSGCTSEIDYDDELGLEGSSSTDYELVIIDGGQQASQAPHSSAVDEDAPTEPEDNGQSQLIVYDDKGEFTVQVGLFDASRKANERVKELSALGYPAYVIAVPTGGSFRVRIGYFESRDMAQRFGRIFKEDSGAEFWIDRRSNEMF